MVNFQNIGLVSAAYLAWPSVMNITDWLTDLPSRVNGTTNYRRNSVLLRFHTMKKKKGSENKGTRFRPLKTRHTRMAVASGWPLDPLLIGVFTLRSHRWGTKTKLSSTLPIVHDSPLYDYFFFNIYFWGGGVWGRLYHNTALIPKDSGL
jgi:hypothetical protein